MKILKNNKLGRYVTIIALLLSPLSIKAYSESKTAGSIAENVFYGVTSIENIIKNLCIIVGSFLILNSFFQYKRYRRNSSEMPISRPITTLIVGIVVILISFIPMQFIGE